MVRPVVIGIAGGSGSGKSTVLDRLLEGLGEDSVDVSVVDHDAYYVDLSHRTPEERAGFNFDHPDALETDLLVRQLDRLTGGAPIEKPIYDFTTHTRTDRTQTVDPAPVVIVEGILVLAEPSLVERMDIRIF
ncbi:MAG: uridine kinase, partial [Rhodothermales bacterium]|nr:uridine kinase [Rhodothermales bacterium]